MTESFNDVPDGVLEPHERTLLDEFRDISGPTEAAEARMLAGLRARLESEAGLDEAVAATHEHPAVTAAPQLYQAPSGRTSLVAIAAFAAGVALTLAISQTRPDEPAPAAAPENPVVQAPGTSPTPTKPAVVHATPPSTAVPGQATPATVDGPVLPTPEPARSRTDGLDDEAPKETTAMAERAGTREEDRDEAPADEQLASTPARRDPRHGALDPRGTATRPASVRGGTWTSVPSQAPSNASGYGRSFGPVEVGPSAGFGGGTQAPPSPSSQPASPTNDAPSSDPPSDGNEPEPEPRDEPEPKDGPEPKDEPEPEPEDEPEDEGKDEPNDEDDPMLVCQDTHQSCLQSAELYCKANPEGCPHYFEFCDLDLEVCMGNDPIGPINEPPQEPQCEEVYEHCMIEYEMFCGADVEPAPWPVECDMIQWQCEAMYSDCMNEEPPPSPDEW